MPLIFFALWLKNPQPLSVCPLVLSSMVHVHSGDAGHAVALVQTFITEVETIFITCDQVKEEVSIPTGVFT